MSDPCKAWLNSYSGLQQDVKSLLAKQEELRGRVCRVTSSLNGDVAHGNSDRNALLAIFADANEQCERRLTRAIKRSIEIENFIGKVPDPNQRALLRDRYLNGMKWAEIAESLGYELRHIHRLHGKALQVARKMFMQEQKERE